jgi:hypothetical protein
MRRTYNKQLGIYEELGKKGALAEPRPGPGSGGQSGDTQGLSGVASASSESVKELVEEGQYAEAALLEAIEDGPEVEEGSIWTREVSTEDVPEEYLDAEELGQQSELIGK